MQQLSDTSYSAVYNAYTKFTQEELKLFLKVRKLPTTGFHEDLVSRLTNHDLHTYHFATTSDPGSPSLSSTFCYSEPTKTKSLLDLPIEIIADILDKVGDWELAKAVGVPTSLSRPLEWTRASPADIAFIGGNLPLIRATLNDECQAPTKIGAALIVRFGYVNVLEYLLMNHYQLFQSLYKDDLIPIKASRHGRTGVLSWWKHVYTSHPDLIPPPRLDSIAAAIDGASRNGQVSSLDWFFDTPDIPFEYTDGALEHASAKNQIAVLEWWKTRNITSRLPLKIGRVMDAASTSGNLAALSWWASSQLDFTYDKNALYHASCHGRLNVLQWWLGSGLQLMFDPAEVLVGATKHDKADVLSWWDRSGLPMQYRMCDIEEALEDAIGGGVKAREWWKAKGVDFGADDKEWVKLQNLN